MDYKFYCNGNTDCFEINNDYQGIKNPKDLYDALSNIWCEYTCAPRLRKNWSEQNKTLGQCSITAFLAQDIFGGKVYGIPRPDGSFHCYNAVNHCVFDLTSEQFGDEILDYSLKIEQFRDSHFADENKRERYEYLCHKLKEYLNEEDYLTNKKSKNTGLVSLSCLMILIYFWSIFIYDNYISLSTARSKIPININNKTYNVTAGEWVVVNNSGLTATYNVRFVDGKAVALELTQYQKIIFGAETPEAADAKSTTKENQTSRITTNNKPLESKPNPKNTIETLKEPPFGNSSENKGKRESNNPFMPNPTNNAAQTNYPIVYNVEIIKEDDDENSDDEKDNVEEKVS